MGLYISLHVKTWVVARSKVLSFGGLFPHATNPEFFVSEYQQKPCKMKSSSSSFRCENSECDREYNSYNNLLRHYRVNKQCKPENIENKKKLSAKEIVCDVLLPENISEGTRSARIKAFVGCLSKKEVKEHFLQPVVEQTSPWEFVLAKASSSVSGSLTVDKMRLAQDFVALRESLNSTYPEVKLLVAESSVNNTSEIPTPRSMLNFVVDNKNLLCKALLEAENGKIFRERLMPLVMERYKENFVEFASGIVGSFCLGQKQLQDVLRNTWGKYLSSVLGVNVIPPKDLVVENLKKKKKELTELIGLQFEVHDDVVVAKVNVSKYLEYLLSRPAVQISAIAPQNKILFYQFTDLAPWLKWSRYFTGITTSRLKVVECHNLNRLVITTGVYLGPDDYDTIRKCFGELYQEYGKLNKIHLPSCESPVEVFYRSCADGKQRRVDTGNSSSRSTFPIPDAPEHISLLGNMLVISNYPVWSHKDSKDMEQRWQQAKPPITRSEFARNNLGNQGRENLTYCDMENYYPGTMHLAIRSLETLSVQIGMCASGK